MIFTERLNHLQKLLFAQYPERKLELTKYLQQKYIDELHKKEDNLGLFSLYLYDQRSHIKPEIDNKISQILDKKPANYYDEDLYTDVIKIETHERDYFDKLMSVWDFLMTNRVSLRLEVFTPSILYQCLKDANDEVVFGMV